MMFSFFFALFLFAHWPTLSEKIPNISSFQHKLFPIHEAPNLSSMSEIKLNIYHLSSFLLFLIFFSSLKINQKLNQQNLIFKKIHNKTTLVSFLNLFLLLSLLENKSPMVDVLRKYSSSFTFTSFLLLFLLLLFYVHISIQIIMLCDSLWFTSIFTHFHYNPLQKTKKPRNLHCICCVFTSLLFLSFYYIF